MAKFRVASLSEVKPGSLKMVVVNGVEICLANVEGKIYAIGNKCNHKGGPLAEGSLVGAVVICPWHGSQWDVKTGNLVWFIRPLQSMPTHATMVEGDEIYVEI